MIRRVDECDIKLRDLYQTREYVLTKDLTEDKIEEAYKIEERLRAALEAMCLTVIQRPLKKRAKKAVLSRVLCLV